MLLRRAWTAPFPLLSSYRSAEPRRRRSIHWSPAAGVTTMARDSIPPAWFSRSSANETTATKPHDLVGRAGELGGRVDRGSRRASPGAPAAKSPGKANWLTDGGDNQRTAWQRNETRISTDSVKNMKLLWKLQLDNQPRQMHNLFPPLIVTRRDDRAGAEGDRRRGRRLRQHLRRRRRDRHAALVAEVRQHVRRTAGRPRRRRAVSRRTDRDARHRADRHAGQVHRLRRVVGRPAAHARRGDRDRRRAARAISAAQRQALRAEPLQGRHLHDDGAGLRRQSERVLRLRPGDEEGRSVPARQRRHVAAHRSVDRQGRHGLRRHRATATTIPSARSTASRSSA